MTADICIGLAHDHGVEQVLIFTYFPRLVFACWPIKPGIVYHFSMGWILRCQCHRLRWCQLTSSKVFWDWGCTPADTYVSSQQKPCLYLFLGLYMHRVFAQTLVLYNRQSLEVVNISCPHTCCSNVAAETDNTQRTRRFNLVDAPNLQLATVAIKRESSPYEFTISSTYRTSSGHPSHLVYYPWVRKIQSETFDVIEAFSIQGLSYHSLPTYLTLQSPTRPWNQKARHSHN